MTCKNFFTTMERNIYWMDIIVEFYTTTSLPEDLGCPQGDVEGSIEVDREENVDNK